MMVMIVYCQVKPEFVEAFREACLENARNSVQEPGCARFDVLQQQDDPTRFVLYEAYRTPEDHPKHRETAHYAQWRDTVADMFAGPRSAVKYESAFPEDAAW
jgi:quinol monooxygenase YgiN